MNEFQKAEALRIQREEEMLRERYGVAFYQPHPKQDMFHRCGETRLRYLRTGNRFGKSDVGAAEDVAHLLGERVWYSKDDPARYSGLFRRSTKGLLICTNWDKANEIFLNQTKGASQGKLFKFIPKDSLVKVIRQQSGFINKIEVRSIWGDVSTLYIDTVSAFKSNEQKGESSWWDFIHVDEPIPKEMWEAVSRGLMDSNGKGWFTCTPICEPWINKLFVPSRRAELANDRPNYFPQLPNRCIIIGSSFDNPYVSKDGIENYLDGLSEDAKHARIHGVPLEESGAIYYMFGEDHIYSDPPEGWKDAQTPPDDYSIRFAVDPHPKTPHAVLFAATSPEGKVYFYDEIFDPCSSKELAEQILSKIDGKSVMSGIIDPSGCIPSMTDKSTMMDDLAMEGLIVEKASKDLKRGLIAVKQALSQPGFLNFHESLHRTIFEFDAYVWDNPVTRPNKPRDKDDHMMENLYRLVLGGLQYVAPYDYVESSSSFNFATP